MTRVGRVTLIVVLSLVLLFLGGVWWMLDSIQRRMRPPCLDRVAEAPVPVSLADSQWDGPDHEVISYADGTQVRILRKRDRIVSTLPGITEMVAYVGAGDRLVAVSEHCDHPPEVVKGLARVSVLPFDPEGVLAARPELLIVDSRLHRRDLGVIRSRVASVLPLDTSHSLPHLVHSFGMLAMFVGDHEGRRRYVDWSKRQKELVADIAKRHIVPPPRVLVVGQWDPLYVLGKGSLIDDLLRVCGCINVACDLDRDASGTFPEELVLARKPDWILTPRKPMPDRLRERWKNVPAVKDGRMIDGSADDLVRAGPRILDGLERLANALLGPEKSK